MSEVRRLWTPTELQLLVELVGESYQYLTGALNNSKSKTQVDNRWKDITAKINALGEGTEQLSILKVKKRCFDLKSTSKKAVVSYNKQLQKTGAPGSNPVKKPTDLQFKVVALIGSVHTEGIAGTEMCDSSSTSRDTLAISNPTNGLEVSLFNQALPDVPRDALDPNQAPIAVPSSPSLAPMPTTPGGSKSKRPKMSKREAQNVEIIEAEKSMVLAVNEMRDEVRQLNTTAVNMLEEMRRSNNIQEQLVGMLACNLNNPEPSLRLNTYGNF